LYKKFKPPNIKFEGKSEKEFHSNNFFIVNKILNEDMKNQTKSQGYDIEGWTFICKNSKKIKKINEL